jgi:hypothetical protein
VVTWCIPTRPTATTHSSSHRTAAGHEDGVTPSP